MCEYTAKDFKKGQPRWCPGCGDHFFLASLHKAMAEIGKAPWETAVISGIGELLGRALGGWLAVHQLGYFGICISNPLAWGLALCYCVFMVTRVLKKEEQPA